MAERSHIRARASAALALLVGLTLAACGGIPTSGGVGDGGPIDAEAEFESAFAPQGPRDGASQEEIMIEFINAATNPQGEYAIAKQFLSRNFASQWDPEETARVRDGSPVTVPTSETTWEYTLSTIASITREGIYREDSIASETLEFAFVDEGGQWRIESAPNGVVLSVEGFAAAFRAYPLFFFDPTFAFLVPELRWFAIRSGVASRVVGALVAGQSAQLQQALVSEFPVGTTLGENAVNVSSGVATVDLSDEARAASPASLERMRQQIAMSLGSVSSVSSIVITVGGIEVAYADPGTTAAIATPEVEPNPLLGREGDGDEPAQFGFAEGDDIIPLGQLSRKVVDVGGQAATLARDKSVAAVLGSAGVYAIPQGSGRPVLVDTRGGLIAPSIDNLGFVWSVPRASAVAIRTFEVDGTPHEVASTLPADARIVSLDVSRDGARVLLYFTTNAGPRLAVAGITRQDRVPVALGELINLPITEATPVDAAWVDAFTVATLARTEEGSTLVRSYMIGGPSENLGQLSSGSSITGSNNGVDGLFVRSADGVLYRPGATNWRRTDITASFLATQQ